MLPRSNKIAINRNVNIVSDDDETVWLEFVYLIDSIRIIVDESINRQTRHTYIINYALCQLLVRFRLDSV